MVSASSSASTSSYMALSSGTPPSPLSPPTLPPPLRSSSSSSISSSSSSSPSSSSSSSSSPCWLLPVLHCPSCSSLLLLLLCEYVLRGEEFLLSEEEHGHGLSGEDGVGQEVVHPHRQLHGHVCEEGGAIGVRVDGHMTDVLLVLLLHGAKGVIEAVEGLVTTRQLKHQLRGGGGRGGGQGRGKRGSGSG